MVSKTKVIDTLRSFLGDETTSWLHAIRYYWLLHARPANEVDMHLIPRLVREGDVVIDVGVEECGG